MDWSTLLDNQHGPMGIVLSILGISFLQLIIKIINLYLKNVLKRDEKRAIDIRRAFKAIRIMAGNDWPKIREEIMKDEKLD